MDQQSLGHAWRTTVATLAVACVVLAGCAGTPAKVGSGDAGDPRAGGTRAEGHTDKQVSVFCPGPTDERATLSFYDEAPNVAYINVVHFDRILMP
jgi:hypothetical protein